MADTHHFEEEEFKGNLLEAKKLFKSLIDITNNTAIRYELVKPAEVTIRIFDVQGKLARSGRHRIPIPDLVIAAAAEAGRLTVLHYDADFDIIASVTRQPVEWVVPRGTVP